MSLNEEEIYQEHVLDHYEDPYHRGQCEHATHAHEDDNPLCGDVIRIELKIGPNKQIDEAWFEGDGCCISQAAASMLVEEIEGKTVEDIQRFTAPQMLELFQAKLTPNRQKCCLLSWQVLQSALFSPTNGEDGPQDEFAGPDWRILMSTVEATLPMDVQRVRADFPILQTKIHGDKPLVYLDNAATTQRPRQVINALVETYEKHYANVHRGIHWLSDQSTDLYEDSREKVRHFIGAEKSCQVIFTSGTTLSINLVARSWGDAMIGPGDEVLLSELEHHSNLVPWFQLAERTGCKVRLIPISDDGQLQLDSLDSLVNDRTRLISIASVSNVLGTITPVEEIVRRGHEVGAVVMIDAAQSAPHEKLDVKQWDADFVAFSGHKMLGPSGIGILYGREELLEKMPPFLGGGSMIRRVRHDGFEPADLPAKFEAGTPPIVPAIGLGAAIDYLAQFDLDGIKSYEQTLVARTHEVLESVGDVTILGPSPEQKGGIVSFTMQGIHAHDIAQLLDREGIAIRAGHHCAMPLHKRLGIGASSRVSFYFYNTIEEVTKLGDALTSAKKVFRRS